MPNFSSSLPKLAKHQGFDLRRTPTSGAITAICTCEAFVACDTHYWRGRTLPCERIVNEDGKTVDDTTCDACVAKQGFRSHAYVSAYNAKTAEHFLYECTANAAKAFEEYQIANGTLRGCVFNASRPKCVPNGKVVIVTNTVNLAKVHLPNPPDLVRALGVIWRIPVTALPSSPADFGSSVIHPDPKILDVMKSPADDDGPGIDLAAARAKVLSDLDRLSKSNGKRKDKTCQTS